MITLNLFHSDEKDSMKLFEYTRQVVKKFEKSVLISLWIEEKWIIDVFFFNKQIEMYLLLSRTLVLSLKLAKNPYYIRYMVNPGLMQPCENVKVDQQRLKKYYLSCRSVTTLSRSEAIWYQCSPCCLMVASSLLTCVKLSSNSWIRVR